MTPPPMAAPSFRGNLFLCLILLFAHLFPLLGLALPPIGSYSAIFSFGDSLTDTGNSAYFSRGDDVAKRIPYGETYFHRPSGRYSDGRIVLDFIAQAMGLPLVPPYEAGHGSDDFARGANFAVGGGCALSNTFYEKKGFNLSREDHSLVTQLKWFQQLLATFSSSSSVLTSSTEILNNSLFVMGEIGVNDYHNLLQGNESIDYARTSVPPVVNAIASAIDELTEMGAKTVIVAGMFPMGCIPLFLTKFQTQNTAAYEPETGCLKSLNEFSQYHNLLLKYELRALQKAHPHSRIIYADYYKALMDIYRSPEHFGMKWPLVACCGGEGPYNFSFSVGCSDPASKWCSDPLSYVCWDGMHYTEAACQVIARGILDGSYVEFPSKQTCFEMFDEMYG
ncbi:GDSL esterase/lipase [Canna indica]|uniref:GDSL esterase/lipase n=1 Tax=Canna indica TaxID=4628 RepID=A0AAQ3KJZ7_9LILI|nr:GDSL esterase/lipase [Canna indica]